MAGPSFADDGYVVVEGLVDREMTAAVRAELGRHKPSLAQGGRLLNAWERFGSVRALAVDRRVVALARDLYGREPVPFQTLNFARGTEQHPHADALFFDSWPRGWMCGVWIACEGIGPASGPLRVWPGSHLLPSPGPAMAGCAPGEYDEERYDAFTTERVRDIDPVDLTLAEGDAVVWAADLVHGGAPVIDRGSTRWSQVTHFTFDGLTYISPFGTDEAAERFLVRDQMTDVATGRRVTHEVDGLPVRFVHEASGRSRLVVNPPTRTRAVLVLADLVHGGRRPRRWARGVITRIRRRITGTDVT